MGTYDYTSGSKSENAKMLAYAEAHNVFVLKRKFTGNVALASDSTLTTNGKFTTGDIMKIIGMPDDTLVLLGGVKILAAWSCTDLDMGRAGGDEIFDGYDISAGTVGDHKITAVGDDWGANSLMGYVFTAADTIDIKFTGADETYVTAGGNNCQGLFWVLCADVSDISVDEFLD